MSAPDNEIRLPLFALNTVVFPGMTIPLHVFEDRYRALVRDLVADDDPASRVFGITAIREGYEVGEGTEATGRQSLYTTGTMVQLTECERMPDGRFEIEAVGRQRFSMSALSSAGEYPVGTVELIQDDERHPLYDADEAETEQTRALSTFERYRQALSRLQGGPVLVGELPRDPVYLSWSLAASVVLPLSERQQLLEAPDATTRLRMIRRALVAELRAMAAHPSLPATEVARTRWSPN